MSTESLMYLIIRVLREYRLFTRRQRTRKAVDLSALIMSKAMVIKEDT